MKKLIIKILNLKLVIMLEFQSIKTYLLKGICLIGVKKFVDKFYFILFFVDKIKNTVPWTYLINDLNGEEITGTFNENELQKTNQKEFRIEKVIKRKGNKLYVKWKGYDNSFNSWINKNDIIK